MNPLTRQTALRGLLAASLLTQSMLPATAGWNPFKKKPPKTKPSSRIEVLASHIDDLESQIDGYGSVVLKQPDVWGEARWTRHREEYEQQLAEELDNFQFTVNASISQADTAFFLNATALSGAIAPGGGGGGGAGPVAGLPSLDFLLADTRQARIDGFQEVLTSTPTDELIAAIRNTVNPPTPSPPPAGPAIPNISAAAPFGDAFPQPQFLGLPTGPTIVSPTTGNPVQGVAIEPTLFLDQLSRYVQALNQLRRINEGDDTADAPGYALNLMRMPASILPGTYTREGYGAEVQVTLEPELTDSLLPETFRDLVINDVVDQLSLPVLKLAEFNRDSILDVRAVSRARDAGSLKSVLESAGGNESRITVPFIAAATVLYYRSYKESGDDLVGLVAGQVDEDASADIQSLQMLQYFITKAIGKAKDKGLSKAVASYETVRAILDDAIRRAQQSGGADTASPSVPPEPASVVDRARVWVDEFGELFRNILTARQLIAGANTLLPDAGGFDQGVLFDIASDEVLDEVKEASAQAIADARTRAALEVRKRASIGATRDRVARFAVPDTLLACVHGEDNLLGLATDLDLSNAASENGMLHLIDSQAFLRDEAEAAYRALTAWAQDSADLWQEFGPDVKDAVAKIGRATSLPTSGRPADGSVISPLEIARLREKFRDRLKELFIFSEVPGFGRNVEQLATCNTRTIEALMWAIIVESALLSDHLNEDMKRTDDEKSCCFYPGELTFYGNTDHQPSTEAREVFNQYVKCKYPIHVFAIDPQTQDQNVRDAFARRRETQLALSLAFAGGQVNAENFSRFARRLDFQLETVALNRTVVGFSHGEDTFGWRFFPRVQTPPVESNLEVLFREQLLGAPDRDRDLSRRQIEPGPRELLAIVIMPSFVPHLRMDVKTNWFELTDPKEKLFDLQDSVRLGRDLNYLRQCKADLASGDRFARPGDARRLMKAIDGLEKRLPLQETLVKIPIENTLGGFQLFGRGTRSLGPELLDYYGDPGVSLDGPSELFLVGRNFNVNITDVIVAGHDIEPQLISRDVMRVTVPPVSPDKVIRQTRYVDGRQEAGNYVAAHLATPYGPSAKLLIPVRTVTPPNGAAATSPLPYASAPPTLNPHDGRERYLAEGERPTTLFLTGSNFASPATVVIAGGLHIPVDGTRASLIGPGTLRVEIPAGATTRATRGAYRNADPNREGTLRAELAVRVATPFGVSNEITIDATPTPSQTGVIAGSSFPALTGSPKPGPVLTGFFGAPGFEPDKDESTTFILRGKNFTSANTVVVAGGEVIPVDGERAELISPGLIRVDVPGTAATTSGLPTERTPACCADEDVKRVLRVNVATANGVSNDFCIPVLGESRSSGRELTNEPPKVPGCGRLAARCVVRDIVPTLDDPGVTVSGGPAGRTGDLLVKVFRHTKFRGEQLMKPVATPAGVTDLKTEAADMQVRLVGGLVFDADREATVSPEVLTRIIKRFVDSTDTPVDQTDDAIRLEFRFDLCDGSEPADIAPGLTVDLEGCDTKACGLVPVDVGAPRRLPPPSRPVSAISPVTYEAEVGDVLAAPSTSCHPILR